MKKTITFLLFCFTSLVVFCQPTYKAEEFQSAVMQKKNGALVVFTGQYHSFTMDIIGDSIKPSNEPNFITVDNKILQLSNIPFPSKVDYENLSDEIQKNNLLGYMNYEMKYIKEQLNLKSLNEKYEFITLNDKICMFWKYDMPKSYKTIDKQCYLITNCFDQILVLNSPVTKGEKSNSTSYDSIKDFLLTIGKTLKLNNHTIDLENLYKEINKK